MTAAPFARTRAADTSPQPVGAPLPDWRPAAPPAAEPLSGCGVRLEPLHPARHADALFAAYRAAADGRDWTYLPVGPFASADAFRAYLDAIARTADPLHYAVVDNASGLALGTLALMRQQPAHGVIEVGCVAFSPALQGTRLATAAQFLLMSYVFDRLGYRRYEWKCDRLNQRSRRAAQRLGFRYEGTFRQAMVYKGRNRDTAWFSIIDAEWPPIRAALLRWLDADNFDAHGRQRARLASLRAHGG